MTSRKATLVRGYARRMVRVAEMVTEMNDIKLQYEREFSGDESLDDALRSVMAGDALASVAARLRAGAAEHAGDVPEEPRDAQPSAGGAGAEPDEPGFHTHGDLRCHLNHRVGR